MSRRPKKVDIIIPCFNREKLVCETIESVLDQTYPNIEVIAIDDGSTDGTLKSLERYNRHITILEHKERTNKGQSAAINLGLGRSTGEFIGILDSDDLFHQEKIEIQVNYLETNEDIDVVYCNGYAIDKEGKLLYKLKSKGHEETNDPRRMLLECHFNIPSNALVRTRIYDLVGQFDETLRYSQDHDMGVRIAEVAKLAYHEEPLWYYRLHDDSISHKHQRGRWESGHRILVKACNRYPYGTRIKRKRLAVLNYRLGQCCLIERKYSKAFGHFFKSCWYDPLRSVHEVAKIFKTVGDKQRVW